MSVARFKELKKEFKDKINVLRDAGKDDDLIDEEFHSFNANLDDIENEEKILRENGKLTLDKVTEYIKRLEHYLKEINEAIENFNLN